MHPSFAVGRERENHTAHLKSIEAELDAQVNVFKNCREFQPCLERLVFCQFQGGQGWDRCEREGAEGPRGREAATAGQDGGGDEATAGATQDIPKGKSSSCYPIQC